MWRVYKESGRPWPVLCPEDDLIDYMLMEAVAIKVGMEDKKAREDEEKREERETFKKDFSALEEYRN